MKSGLETFYSRMIFLSLFFWTPLICNHSFNLGYKIKTFLTGCSNSKTRASKPDATIEHVPTFGHQPVVLGGFYSAIKTQFIPGLGLLPSTKIAKYVKTIQHPFQETRWTHGLSFTEKLELLKIDIGNQYNFSMTGLRSVSGLS